MNIFGIGTDIVNIDRLKKSLKKNGKQFKNRIFTKEEILYCENKKNSTNLIIIMNQRLILYLQLN